MSVATLVREGVGGCLGRNQELVIDDRDRWEGGNFFFTVREIPACQIHVRVAAPGAPPAKKTTISLVSWIPGGV